MGLVNDVKNRRFLSKFSKEYNPNDLDDLAIEIIIAAKERGVHDIDGKNVYIDLDQYKKRSLNYCPSINMSAFAEFVKFFQKDLNIAEDGIFGPQTFMYFKSFLKYRDMRKVRRQKVLMKIIAFESGGKSDAAARDSEYRLMKAHRAYQKIHIGLSLGYIQMTQDGGTLGKYLSLCRENDQEKFDKIVGGEANAKVLLDVVTAQGPSGFSTGKERGPRVEKIPYISGKYKVTADLWETPWVEIMQRVAREFIDEQFEIAEDIYLIPMLSYLRSKDLLSEKAVAIALDLAIHTGVSGAVKRFNAIDEKAKADTSFKQELKFLDALASKEDAVVQRRAVSRTRLLYKDPELSVATWIGWHDN